MDSPEEKDSSVFKKVYEWPEGKDKYQTVFTQQYKPYYGPNDTWEDKIRRVPLWVRDEMRERPLDPKVNYPVTSISISFLTPGGQEKTMKQYLFKEKLFSIEDIIKAVSMTETKYGIELYKTGYIAKLQKALKLDDIELRSHEFGKLKKGIQTSMDKWKTKREKWSDKSTREKLDEEQVNESTPKEK